MTPHRGIAAALVATGVLYALQTVVAPPPAVMHVAFAVADGVLIASLLWLRTSTALASLALLLAVYELASDALGLLGAKIGSTLAFGETFVTLVLGALLLLVLRSTGRGPRGLFGATAAALATAFAFRLYGMAEHRTPTMVWLSWGAELARLGLLAATAYVVEPKPAPALQVGGPYRQAQPMPEAPPAVEWGAFADDVWRLRKVAIARFATPFATAAFLLVFAITDAGVIGIFTVLAFLVARAVTGALVVEQAGRIRRTAPPPMHRALDVVAFAAGTASLVDLVLAIAFFLVVSSPGHQDWVLLAVPLSGGASLLALGAIGQAASHAATAIGDDRTAARALWVARTAAAIFFAIVISVGFAFAGSRDAGLLVLIVLIAAFGAWVAASGRQIGVLGDVATAARAMRD